MGTHQIGCAARAVCPRVHHEPPKKTNAIKTLHPPKLIALAGLLAFIPPLHAQVEEDEWYDPTDWFNGNNIESDDTYDYTDTWDYDYDNDYWDGYTWYDSVYDRDYNTTMTRVYPYYWQAYYYTPARDNQWNNDRNNTRSDRDNRSSSADRSSDRSQRMTLRGTVQGVRDMQLRDTYGNTETFTIAKVKLDNGNTSVVNLGRQAEFRRNDLQKGDQIKAVGSRGRIAGQDVFVARQIKADGRTLYVNDVMVTGDRSSSSSSSRNATGGDRSYRNDNYRSSDRDRMDNRNRTIGPRSQNQPSGNDWNNRDNDHDRSDYNRNDRTTASNRSNREWDQTLRGEVASFERVRAGQTQHTLVRITLDNGRSELVDLGANASLSRLDLSSGDQISVRGRDGQVADRSVLVAKQIRVDGRLVDAQR